MYVCVVVKGPDPEYMSRSRRPQSPCGEDCFILLESALESESESETSSRCSSPFGVASSQGDPTVKTTVVPQAEPKSDEPSTSTSVVPYKASLAPVNVLKRKRTFSDRSIVSRQDQGEKWSGSQKTLYNVFKPVYGYNYCSLSKVIGKPCKEVVMMMSMYTYIQYFLGQYSRHCNW